MREQFTDEQWERFPATRRFVDEEVPPVINDYWKPAERWSPHQRPGGMGSVTPP